MAERPQQARVTDPRPLGAASFAQPRSPGRPRTRLCRRRSISFDTRGDASEASPSAKRWRERLLLCTCAILAGATTRGPAATADTESHGAGSSRALRDRARRAHATVAHGLPSGAVSETPPEGRREIAASIDAGYPQDHRSPRGVSAVRFRGDSVPSDVTMSGTGAGALRCRAPLGQQATIRGFSEVKAPSAARHGGLKAFCSRLWHDLHATATPGRWRDRQRPTTRERTRLRQS